MRTGLIIAWSMLWRATLLAPAGIVFTVLVVGAGVGRFAFPALFLIHLYTRDGTVAGAYLAASIASLLLWRSPRFRRLLEWPPSCL